MLAVAGAFPLTSDQPPLALVDPAMLGAGMAGWRSPAAGVAQTSRPVAGQAVPPGSETPAPPRIEPPRDPRALVGPRPAFEANVLDAERRFETTLARIELERSQQEMRRGSGGAAPDPGVSRSAGTPPHPADTDTGAASGAPHVPGEEVPAGLRDRAGASSGRPATDTAGQPAPPYGGVSLLHPAALPRTATAPA